MILANNLTPLKLVKLPNGTLAEVAAVEKMIQIVDLFAREKTSDKIAEKVCRGVTALRTNVKIGII